MDQMELSGIGMDQMELMWNWNGPNAIDPMSGTDQTWDTCLAQHPTGKDESTANLRHRVLQCSVLTRRHPNVLGRNNYGDELSSP